MAWSLVAKQALPANARGEADCLGPVLSTLFPDKPQGKVTLVVESAWLPVLLADTGGVLWGTAQVEALVRHRLRALHGSPEDDLAAWDVRADGRAGDRFALGYGLAPRVKQALLDGAGQAGLQVEALTPAFVWGWQSLRPARRWPGKTGWWVWPEQDRLLVSRIAAGRLVAFNPAAPLADTSPAVERIVNVEAARWGLDGPREPASVAAWLPPVHLPLPSGRLVWHSLIGDVVAQQESGGQVQPVKVPA